MYIYLSEEICFKCYIVQQASMLARWLVCRMMLRSFPIYYIDVSLIIYLEIILSELSWCRAVNKALKVPCGVLLAIMKSMHSLGMLHLILSSDGLLLK